MGYELGQDEIPYTHTSVSLCKLRKRILIDVALLITQIGIGLHHLHRKYSLRGPASPGHQLAVYWLSWYKMYIKHFW